jgi:polyhydroxybutyrate depolymerase
MKRSMFILSILLLSLGALPACAHKGGGEFEDRTLDHGGVIRAYAVHYPRNQTPDHPLPLVFALHGAGGADAQSMSRSTGFNAIADREGFILVYPQGINGNWNDGRGKVFNRRKDISKVDDVGFVSRMLDQFVASGQADPRRIYITGVSNGGMMTHRLGIELSEKLAAIAPVIANIPTKIATRRPAQPLSVLVMNGTEDSIIPWAGGDLRRLGRDYGSVLSTEQSVTYWADVAQLPLAQGRRQLLADRLPDDRCQVAVDTFRLPGREAEVVLYSIIGGGHTVPGSTIPDFKRIVGPKCMEINAAEVIWEFFKRHSRGSD